MNNNTFCTLFLVSSHIPLREASVQWSKELFRIFCPEIIDQLKPREARFWHFENVILVARRREHFRGFLADFFVAELPQKKRCFNTQEFTRFLSTGVVSASSDTLWRVLSNKVIRVFGHRWVDIPHIHASEWDSLFFWSCLSSPSRSRRVTRIMSIEALLFNSFG